MLTFAAIAVPQSLLGKSIPGKDIIGPLLGITSLSFGLVLPFWVLSFTNSFYRDGLKSRLRLSETPAPSPPSGPPDPVH